MHYHDEGRHGGNFITGFVAGAAAALLAGGYYLYGPNGRQHRKKFERRAGSMRDDILERMEDAKDMTEAAYQRVVDEVAESYALGKRLTSAQAKRAAARFKSRWQDMKQAAEDAAEEAELEVDEMDA